MAENSNWLRRGRIRTFEWRIQSPLPYHLATPEHEKRFLISRTGHKTPEEYVRMRSLFKPIFTISSMRSVQKRGIPIFCLYLEIAFWSNLHFFLHALKSTLEFFFCYGSARTNSFGKQFPWRRKKKKRRRWWAGITFRISKNPWTSTSRRITFPCSKRGWLLISKLRIDFSHVPMPILKFPFFFLFFKFFTCQKMIGFSSGFSWSWCSCSGRNGENPFGMSLSQDIDNGSFPHSRWSNDEDKNSWEVTWHIIKYF